MIRTKKAQEIINQIKAQAEHDEMPLNFIFTLKLRPYHSIKFTGVDYDRDHNDEQVHQNEPVTPYTGVDAADGDYELYNTDSSDCEEQFQTKIQIYPPAI